MKGLVQLSVLLSFSAFVAAQDPKEALPQPEPKVLFISGNRFVYRDEYVLHPISLNDWAKRASLGVPYDARRCGGPFYLYFSVSGGVKQVTVGLFVESKDKKLQAIEPADSYTNSAFDSPKLIFGVVQQYGAWRPLANYLLLPPGQNLRIRDCASESLLST
jgi:hypothetical protein